MDEDVYYLKTVPFRFGKQQLVFKVSQELFSSHDIDTGTRFLLRTIIEADYEPPDNILDLGCGYGPLGLTLKQIHPESRVHMVDRDALALVYSRKNAALNGLDDGVEVYGSLGYDDARRDDFDLIVSNIPGKAGEPVISYLLCEACHFLSPGGIVAVVVVAPLESLVEEALAGVPSAEIIFRRGRSGHTVFHYRFPGERPQRPDISALERGVYNHREVVMHGGNLEYTMRTAYGLPEFDSLDRRTELLIKVLSDAGKLNPRRCVVFNPGQGHLPVALYKILRPQTILLVDRDRLALKYSRLNLIINGCPEDRIFIEHRAGPGEYSPGIDLFLAVLREEEGREAVFQAVDAMGDGLAADGKIVLAAGSTTVTRLVAHLESERKLRVTTREKRRGNGLLVLGRE